MKKMIVFGLIMLSLIIFSPIGLCSKIGVENAWKLSSQTNLSLFTGVYTEDYSAYQPVGNGRLVYKWNKVAQDMELILEFEKCNRVYEWFYAGYTMPLISTWDMNVGVIFGEEAGKVKEYVQVRSTGSYNYGDVTLENKFGSNEEMLSILYSYGKQITFLNDMLIKGELGLSYQRDDLADRELTVPVKIIGLCKLINSVNLLIEVSNEYSTRTGDFADTRFTVCLKLDWNTETYETSMPAEESLQTTVLPGGDVEDQTDKEPFIAINEVNVEKYDYPQNNEVNSSDVVDTEQILDNRETLIGSGLDVSNEKELAKQPEIDYDVETGIFYYKGKEINVKSYVDGDKVFLPIKQIMESLDGRVYWDEDLKQIYIVQDVQRILVDVESKYFMADGYYFVIDECVNINGHYYLEVEEFKRLISENRVDGLLAKPYSW